MITVFPAERAALTEKAKEIVKDITKCDGVACVVARIVNRDTWTNIEIICPVNESASFKSLLENGFLTTAKLSKIGAYRPVVCVTNVEEGTTSTSAVSEVLIDNTSNKIVVEDHNRAGNDLEFKFQNPEELSYIDYDYFK